MAIAMALCGASGGWTRITLSRPSAGGNETLGEIARFASVRFGPLPGNRRMAVNLDETPFWEAAISLAEREGQKLQMATLSPAERNVELSSGRPSIARTTSGPLTISVENIIPRAHVPGTSEVMFRVYADPSLTLFAFFESAALDEAIDATGNSLLMRYDEDQSPPSASLISTHYAVIRKPQGAIRKMRGSFTLLVADILEQWTPSTLGANARKRIGQYTYTLRSMGPSGGGFQVALTIKGPADEGFKNGIVPMMLSDQSMLLCDAEGKRWRISSIEGRYLSKAMTGMAYYDATVTLAPTPGAGAPASLTWLIPTQISTVDVPFEFAEIKMP